MTNFILYDEDREEDDSFGAEQKPSEDERKPIVISLYYFDLVMDE